MPHPLDDLLRRIDPEGTILDVGCLNFAQVRRANQLGLTKFKHFGVDYSESADVPPGFQFAKVDLNQERLPFDDDKFDLVIASHVIEHLALPIPFFADCVRICKPGGLLYFEAPSERSLLLPGMPFDREKFFSISFFDDPTHMYRPWTPQAFYRLTRYFSCEPLKVGHLTSWKHRLAFPIILAYALVTKNGKWLEQCVWGAVGWSSYLMVRKPIDLLGQPSFKYYIPKR